MPDASTHLMTPAAYLDAHGDDIAGLLSRLVRVPTINPPGECYDVMTALLAQELATAGLRARRFRMPARLLKEALPPDQRDHARFNVLGLRKSRGAVRTIHFNAHYDVVPVSGTWSHGSPFSGTVDRGWVYGRGTADMKGSMASLIFALRALQVAGVEPRMNVEVSFTADEETDSVLGASWLVQHAPIEPDYAVVMEGGEADKVCCGHNGVVWLNVTVHGRAAHGSRPQEGVNAFEKMASLVRALEPYRRSLAERLFPNPDGSAHSPTLNLGGMFAPGPGGKINTVPASASFTIDRRVIPSETVASAERELRAAVQQAAREVPGCRVSIDKISDNHPCFLAPEHSFHQAMASAVTAVRRRPAIFTVSTGFNDMHFFAHHLRIPTLGYGPGGDHCHGVDERASVRELVRTAKVYAALLTEYAG